MESEKKREFEIEEKIVSKIVIEKENVVLFLPNSLHLLLIHLFSGLIQYHLAMPMA